ncbi:MFS general substrate transporter [Rhizophagus clarus]|uniref:MFS general substrate transporter n=1 Tax=Rhizophagus clarus TaxID=94130 RepID=A0A8H3L3T9_9GLOM|nr:MFS general substrate transporter [Rhizophagus clarus]
METDKTDDFQKEEESYNVEEIFVEDKVFEKKLLRKIDFRIMPLLTLLYLLSFLDRVSIGNAKLAHIERDLGLVGAQFNWCLSIFFFGYTLFEIPSNFILIRTNPSVSFYDDIMGICNDAYVFVNNFSELMSARFFLGACEAGFFPGAIYYITTWYKRSETNSRIAIFFIGNSFAGSLSGLLAYCVVRLDGKLDLKGWQWLFLIEGLMTIVVSTLSYFFLSNYPEKTKWLSDKERKYAAGRLKNDAGKAHAEHFDKKQIYAALTDWKVYLTMLHLGIICIPFFTFSFFIPTIVNGMGFDYVKSQLLSVPPFFCAGISTLIVAILSDRKRIRSPFIISCSFVAIIGYILLAVPSYKLKLNYLFRKILYAGACIVGAGLAPAIITSITWLTNNIAGHAKRAIATAMVMMCVNAGGAVASQVYRQKDYPHYLLGHSISLGFLIASTTTTIIQLIVFKTLNKKKKENPQSFLKGKTEEEIKNMGDLHPDFIYSL